MKGGCGREQSLPEVWGDGAGLELGSSVPVLSTVLLLPGSGFGVHCQYLSLDFSGCQKTARAWRT